MLVHRLGASLAMCRASRDRTHLGVIKHPLKSSRSTLKMKRIVTWASILYAAHIDGATIHVTGPDERQVEFGDGTTSFATLSGGEGYINSTVTVYAPDFVTVSGASLNEIMALVRAQQTIIVTQQVEINALKEFVGMSSAAPAAPPSPPLTPPSGWVLGERSLHGTPVVCSNVCGLSGRNCTARSQVMQTNLTSYEMVEAVMASIGVTCAAPHGHRDYPGVPAFKTVDGLCTPFAPESSALSSCTENGYGGINAACNHGGCTGMDVYNRPLCWCE